jgi:DNA replication licensing factor MCM7
LQDLNLDEDGLSDEYDFMDDADGDNAAQRTRRRERHPKLKYMKVLQDVADRKQSHILIELDDLEAVRSPPPPLEDTL